MNAAINMGGGLGDILRVYLSGNQGFHWCQPLWGKMEHWIREGNRLRIVVSSHNSFAANFFEYIPWVDAILRVPWRHENSIEVADFLKGFQRLPFHELNRLTSHLSWMMPKVYLSQDEKRLFKELTSSEYIFLYPFGGYGSRISVESYLPLIERILKGGFKVIIGGGTHTRITGGIDDKFMKETIDFDLPEGAVSVVGCGTRLCTALTLKSQAYVGSLGCYMHAALAVGIQSHVLTCWEVWDDDNVCGKNIESNQALNILMRNVKDESYNTELYILMNEEERTLYEIYDMILTGIFCESISGIYRIGDAKREPVHV